jgi:hypothetical protein
VRIAAAVIVALGMIAAGVAHAADIPVASKKLIIVDKTVLATKAKAVFVAKDPAITKGSGTDPAQIGGELDVSYDSASGVFLAPQGSNWLINKSTVAKYVNKPAPIGGATKVAVIKPGKVLKLVAKSLGDTPIDISSPPSGGGNVLAVYTVTNGAETNRHCTNFPVCTHKLIAGGTGYKLVCKNGDPAACPVISTTSTSSSTSTSTSSSSTTSTSTPATSTSSTSSTSTSTSSTTSSTSSTTSTSTSTSSTTSSTTSTSTSTSSTSTSTSSSTTTSTSTTTTTTLAGPSYPPTGGTVTYMTSGAASPGDSGGTDACFSGFSPSSWTALYWGPDSTALPAAGLDGALHTLTFSGISGTTATWAGTSSWTNPGPGSAGPYNVPIEMRLTASSLGATPWATSTSITGLDPGPGTGIGAVVADFPTAVDFCVNVQFLADIPTDSSGFIPLNTVRQGTGGNTMSSFTGAFYSVP